MKQYVTRSLAIVVSESCVVRVFSNGLIITEIIPEIWMMESFIEILQHQFDQSAERPAIVHHDDTITYSQLEEKAKGVGKHLQDKGLQKGDRVVIYTPEKLYFIIIHLGIILSGGVSLPLNFDFTKDEMRYFLNDSGARFLFASYKYRLLINEIEESCPNLKEIIDPAQVMESNSPSRFREAEIKAEDNCLLFYSSGTTGRPKGVVHTHRNLGASLLALQRCWRFAQEDILLNVLPLFHIHGLSFAAHLSLISGSLMILQDRFHPIKTMIR